MDAEFIRDDNVPDGTCVYPGSEFSKRWLLKNTGSSPWAHGTVIEVRPLGIMFNQDLMLQLLTIFHHFVSYMAKMYLSRYFLLSDDWRQHAVRDGAL